MINYYELRQFIGQPWQYRYNDCWAVFKRASEKLFGIKVDEVEIPENENLAKTIEIFNTGAKSRHWKKVETPSPGCAVLFFNMRGHPIHIGLYIEEDFVLHCKGTKNIPGSTMYEKIRDILRTYKKCEFYKYVD